MRKEPSCLLLQEVDSSYAVLGAVTMLNTLRHYKIPDRASVKVITKEGHTPLTTQASLKDDKNYSIKYFHLVDPDIGDQSGNPERKKLKLKEDYLRKLLSTKVAVHSYGSPDRTFCSAILTISTCYFQHSPTNKLLYAKDIPQYKQEVKDFYRQSSAAKED
ncbi:plexin-C1-like [Conger conger]|uniref:plexin-C1-like n=1 Tax=Conger conger TaxID=82655 RepID=UPI002A5ABBDA|nr:plexin-C1-like [Conger conger]